MPSIEILVERPKKISPTDNCDLDFAVKISSPPFSDRKPSLWQGKFDQIGGTLVHLGEKRFKHSTGGWFFAYDLLHETDCKHFRFKPEYFPHVTTCSRDFLADPFLTRSISQAIGSSGLKSHLLLNASFASTSLWICMTVRGCDSTNG